MSLGVWECINSQNRHSRSRRSTSRTQHRNGDRPANQTPSINQSARLVKRFRFGSRRRFLNFSRPSCNSCSRSVRVTTWFSRLCSYSATSEFSPFCAFQYSKLFSSLSSRSFFTRVISNRKRIAVRSQTRGVVLNHHLSCRAHLYNYSVPQLNYTCSYSNCAF